MITSRSPQPYPEGAPGRLNGLDRIEPRYEDINTHEEAPPVRHERVLQ